MSDYLFVYGTLRDPIRLRGLVGEAVSHAGVGTIRAKLYRVDRFPGATPSREPNDVVTGDLYRIDRQAALRALDSYEECDPMEPGAASGLFRRERVLVTRSDGRRMTAWTYFWNGPTSERQRVHAARGATPRSAVLQRRVVPR